jgi:hypothetical protein
LARAPSRQMRFRRNFTKAGDCASQFHPDQILHCGRNPTNARPTLGTGGVCFGSGDERWLLLCESGETMTRWSLGFAHPRAA